MNFHKLDGRGDSNTSAGLQEAANALHVLA
jgi:hypothetical protein